jgi:hypothetical protein
MSLAALLFAVAAAVLKITGALDTVTGWSSLAVLVSFLAGFQLIVLGMIGLYVARAYEQGKRRPLYLVAAAYGFGSGTPRADHVLGSERQPGEPAGEPLQPR